MITENILVAGRKVTNGWTKGTLLSVENGTARVALTDGTVREVEAATLRHSRGRPAKVNPGALVRSEVDALVATSEGFCQDAIALLFARQTSDEQISKATVWDNDLGYRADHALRGSRLALKSPCGWTGEDFATAREVLSRYSGTQLFEVAALHLGRSTGEADALVADVLLDLACMAAIAA